MSCLFYDLKDLLTSANLLYSASFNMSGLDEDKLVEQLVWSSTIYSLAQFVENFDLPQVVRVDEGYYGESDRTSLDSDQILVMHFLRSKQKLVGEDSTRMAIAISLDCRAKCQVYPLPMQCRYNKILTDQMSFVYPETKYFQVSDEHVNIEKREKLLQVGTILEIKTINSKTRSVICENVATKESVSLPFGCSTIFEPLLDYEEYTVKKVRKKFGLPAKVRFLEDKSETWNDPYSAKSIKLVSSLGKVTILHDLVTDTEVVATTVGGNRNSCLQLPKDLSLQLCLAEGLIRDEESYTNIVEALDQEFYDTALNDFDYGETDVYQNLDEIDVGITQGRPFERAESSGGELVATAPELPPRNIRVPPPVRPPKRSSSWNKKGKNWPRDILPKFKPRREQQPAKQSIVQGNTANACSGFPRNYPSSPQNERKENEDLAPLEDSDEHDYTYIDKQDIEDSDNDGEYETIDEQRSYVEEEDTPDYYYADMVSKHDRLPPSIPGYESANELTPDKSDINVASSFIPKDLSALSVDGVAKLLKDLNIECYVATFRKEFVDGEMLMSLDRESLESLHVNPFHVKKLTKVIAGWRPNVQ